MNKTIMSIFAVMFVVGLASYLVAAIKKETPVKLTLSSASFKNGEKIPIDYTCDGKNIPPALSWELKGPEKVASYVLVVDDPDAQKVVGKTFVHWIALFSGTTTSIPEGSTGRSLLAVDRWASELPNSSGNYNTLYKGPCPPKGSGTHIYRFTLFAITQGSKALLHFGVLKPFPCTAEECRERLQGKIIAQALLTGTYAR